MQLKSKVRKLPILLLFMLCFATWNFIQKRNSATYHRETKRQLSHYKINNTECDWLPVINKPIVFKFWSELRHIPSRILKHLKTPKVFPQCHIHDIDQFERGIGSNTINILVLVKSAPDHSLRRDVIRSTWGKLRTVKDQSYTVVFSVAQTNDLVIENAVAKESTEYADVVKCDFHDSYNALPGKMIASFGWILNLRKPFNFYIFVDDDVYLDFNLAVPYFHDRHGISNEKHIFCGAESYLISFVKRNTDSKWCQSYEGYDGIIFPRYCIGAGYAMTKSMLQSIYCMAAITNYTQIFHEDVVVTGILRTKLGIEQTHLHPSNGYVKNYEGDDEFVQKSIQQSWKSYERK